ncbi:MAG TPA: VOC family protein [Chloroflexota bacterium]|nr:VOC family protein [Chloroflexota bacterium]
MSEPFIARVIPEQNHVALKVSDLSAAVRFYHEVVGLPILMKIGPDDDPRSVFVSGIQLTRRTEDPGPRPYGIFDHVGIAVENIEEVCAHLEQAGYHAEVPLERRVLPGVNREILLAFYRDPDGNRLELFHFP